MEEILGSNYSQAMQKSSSKYVALDHSKTQNKISREFLGACQWWSLGFIGDMMAHDGSHAVSCLSVLFMGAEIIAPERRTVQDGTRLPTSG